MDPGENRPSASPSRQLVNSPTAFTITLESIDDLDSFIIREFSLPLNSTFPIGRASSNTQKRHLMSAHDNGFIDSPVVSREHAVLSANSDTGRPRVYLTDSHSMHGTMVNNDKLEPHKPRQLSNGDLLQFGADVNRNESSFLARKYRVRAALLPTKMDSFAHGFTVPEAESSDEEEVEGAAHTEANAVPPLPPRYGSQKNPVTIDDSEGPSRTVIEIDDDPVVEKQPLAKKDPSPAPRSPSPPATQPSPQLAIYGDSESEFGGASSMDAMSISMYSSSEEEEEGLEDDEDEIEDELEDELDDDASDASSDVVPDSLESEIKDRESVDADAVRRMKLEAMLNHERQKVTEELPKPTTASASRPPPERTPIAMSSPSLQVNADQQIESFYVPQDLSPLGMMDNPFADMFSAAPPLPPRPLATKPPIWGGDFTTPLPARENTWWAGEPAFPVSYMGTNFGDRPVLFSPAPPPPAVDPMQPKPLTQNWAPTTPPSEANDNKQSPEELRNQIPSAAEMQSPPSMPLDAPTLSPPQHRTKVTISEIVEDHPFPPNPPSPASITSHKRKADVLEDNEENVQDTGSPLLEPVAVNDVASIQGRPKKRLRSRIGSALTTAAAYVVPGTAVAMGLFMYLPDSFFNE